MGYRNTIFYAVTGALFTLFLTMTAAYGFTKDGFPGKKILTIIFMFTMFFSGGLIPTYLVVRGLGLHDKLYTLPVLGAVSFFYIILARTFIKTSIPGELLEAASIDGCSNFGAFFRIVLPLSKPIIAVIALYAAINQWNGYATALIYVSNRSLQPLQMFLREILILEQIDYTKIAMGMEDVDDTNQRYKVAQLIKYAVMIVSTLPIIMFYPFIQKYFVKGVMVGSVKG